MESGPVYDPAAWLALGREHVRQARAGTLEDGHGDVITFRYEIASWPDPWVAAELLTHDLGTDREINIDMVIDAPHVLAVRPAGDAAALLATAESAKGPERIAALEAAWRACFAPELADVIEALDAASPVAAIEEPKKKADLEIAWAKAAATLSPKSAFAGSWPSKWKDAQRRMRVLYQRPRSPLLAAAAVGFARQDVVPYTSVASQKFWQALAWFIAEQGDVRQLPAVEEIERRVATFHGRKEPLVATDALRAFAPKPLADSVRAKLGKLAVPKPAKTAVLSLASPEERAVAADQLQQAGDPRGELITVQERIASGPPTPELLKRQAQLVKKHAKTWCPPSVYRDTCVFRSGIPVAGHLSFRSDSELESFIGSKALATFETLLIDSSNALGTIDEKTIVAVIRSLPNLRCVITTDEAGELLASGPPTAIEHLGVIGRHGRTLAGPGVPALRRLDAMIIRPAWLEAKWFAALAEVGVEKPAEWDELWRSEPGPAVVLTNQRLLHRHGPSGESAWELVASAGVIAARPVVGSTRDSLGVTLALVPSWKGVKALRVPANFVDAAARFAKSKKLAVKKAPAVEPAQLGISLDLA